MLNRIVLIGRITHSLELKYTQAGAAVCNFDIAAERPYKDAQGEKITDFFHIQAWKNLAELICKYSGKGKMIGIDGALHQRKYQTKDGENRTTYEILAANVQFIEFKDNGNGKEETKKPDNAASQEPPAETDNELPF